MIRNLSRSLSILLLVFAAAATVLGVGAVVQTEVWCVAKNDAEDAALQTAINWACGPGGANCGPIQQGAPCSDPADIQQTASYAFNDYYLKHGMADDACYFDNTAALTSLNPSHGGCKFPSSKTVANGSIADSSTPLGTGGRDFADLSGSNHSSRIWFWPLSMSHMFMITWMIYH